MVSKRGQAEAGNAAVLVALIAAIILLYILFLPPSERKELLETPEEGENETENGDNITLLSESPGRIDFLDEDEFEHDIPAFTLFKTTNAQVLERVNPFFVKNSWFDEKTKQATFRVGDLANTGNVILTFTVAEHRGVLIIRLNGQTVFENEVATVNVPPVELPKSLLQGENVLEFAVSQAGWAFWRANEYSLQNVQVVGDITDVSKQESKNTFYLSETEAINLESAKLKFNPECKANQVGILEIVINGVTVFSGVPDCGILNALEFSPTLLESGTNRVVFKTEMGSYIVDRIKVETKLKEIVFPTYYFELDDEEFQDVEDNNKDIILHFEFVKADEEREMEVIINGRKFTVEIDKGDTKLSKNIDDFVREEENYIKIVPRTVLEISKLKVTLG